MPVFNAARYVRDAVQSILQQTFSDLEIIVVDDGSTDDTLDILSTFAHDARLRVISAEHHGWIAALNDGLTLTTGEYIARMDGDDYSLPTRIAQQCGIAAEDPRVVAVGCSYEVIDADGRVRSIIAPPLRHDDLVRRLYHRNPFAAGSVFFRGDALKEVGGFAEDYRAAEDWEVLHRLARCGRLASVGEPVYRWRVHDSNTSSAVYGVEQEAVRRIKDALWREAALPPRDHRELASIGHGYARANQAVGGVMAAQLLETELALAWQMWRRGFRARAAEQLFALARVDPSLWAHVGRDVPTRSREYLRHRRRSRGLPTLRPLLKRRRVSGQRSA